ncbi:MAG: HAMP domain-containing histidine kinase [Bacteroidetes bacterium]|nr:HAMP domain-containing histidine kinase [Bacteroidota bacterium]
MDIYIRKKRWKWILFAVALLIVGVSLWYSNILVNEIRQEQIKNIRIWADAITRKANLVNYTDRLFSQLQSEERKRVSLLAQAQRRIITATNNEDLNFYLSIIADNTTIPVIQVDEDHRIINARNVDFSLDSVKYLTGALIQEFSAYNPIIVNYYGSKKIHLYYKDSRIFSELKKVMDDLLSSFFSEIVVNSASVPVIITDSTGKKVLEYGNLEEEQMQDTANVARILAHMKTQNTPIRVQLSNQGVRYIYYKDSFLLTQLQYYPYFQLGIIGIFLFIAYLLFSTARRSEQNQVWVGLAKETAHQLGTPLSSMIAWIELFKMKGLDPEIVDELGKDIDRLQTITDRFSKIGSASRLGEENLVAIIYDTITYIRSRTSSKVDFIINKPADAEIKIPINRHLFSWVIENLCKNAVDAMDGQGTVDIQLGEENRQIWIDVTDTGKGIPKSKFRTIFHPGFTSKQRGWGLGLTLSKRIIENYHNGKIFVKSSVLNKGTTIRIILRKA